MGEAGIFAEDERVELIEGEVFEQVTASAVGRSRQEVDGNFVAGSRGRGGGGFKVSSCWHWFDTRRSPTPI